MDLFLGTNEIQRIKRNRPSKLSPIAKEIEELYRIHQNCDVVLQELKKRGHETTRLIASRSIGSIASSIRS